MLPDPMSATAPLSASAGEQVPVVPPTRPHLHLVPADKIETGARHPRNNLDWPAVGIFAQRGKNRPNRIGTTICRVLRVEGTRLHLEGLDAVDGTPVLDLKPWVRDFGPRGEVVQPAWMVELMSGYWG